MTDKRCYMCKRRLTKENWPDEMKEEGQWICVFCKKKKELWKSLGDEVDQNWKG